MPTKKANDDENATPMTRSCATDRVHERLLRDVPGYAERRALVEDQAWRASRRGGPVGRSGCTKIPVVVHVVYRTVSENISNAQIASQIDVLNADFRKTNSDIGSVPAVFAGLAADTRVQFELASIDPAGNATDGITRTSTTVNGFTDDDAVKSSASGGADAWPADQYLNMWVARLGGGLLGYAQFPGGPATTDGVVITHSGFGTIGTAAAPFNLGRTATHEIGHWLNLRHIWGDDGTGCSGSDFVDDTPNQGGSNGGKPTFPTISCMNGPNGDLFMNYMDYVDDDSMMMFTTGQVTRMQAALDGPRSTIGVPVACGPGSPVTLKVSDDPQTLKVSDDPQTLKFRDDPVTLKFSDDPQTLKFRDDPVTLKVSDDPQTLKFRDDPVTLKVSDDPQTLKFRDDIGTSPQIDQLKSPVLDKPPSSDVVKPVGDGINPDPGPLANPAINPGGRSGVPFILSTPHHSQAWATSYEGAYQQTIARYEQQLRQYEAVLEQYSAAESGGGLGDGDRAQGDEIFAEYNQLLTEYRQLTGGAE